MWPVVLYCVVDVGILHSSVRCVNVLYLVLCRDSDCACVETVSKLLCAVLTMSLKLCFRSHCFLTFNNVTID